jgi:hypothetical protein
MTEPRKRQCENFWAMIALPFDETSEKWLATSSALPRGIEEHGLFQGVVGYSEGAPVVSTLLVDDLKRRQAQGLGSSFQCAIFFAGWPPLATEGETRFCCQTKRARSLRFRRSMWSVPLTIPSRVHGAVQCLR